VADSGTDAGSHTDTVSNAHAGTHTDRRAGCDPDAERESELRAFAVARSESDDPRQ
jgi:hypothetical protein